ncbi:TATA box-binding protein-associated factor RNA polymerase I subunit A [Corythoichthys intestinalis]|uniref:TATA box-binding protein-associated factor RNA polymerase I subunit A n=1 Tax=Corythoichthys intestinalis TaxID=161448 RepID=UPI0025A5DAD1|nr:TATA box-binding protein-associated factor RNA polymerase I subunit A [Corythoichthys intestinalis]XP_057678793.1 TATA box-binding protein-associated factor RNA polymerase I subunit A [Corythoichthys intestinalis]XP_061806746.1 TATA box-binding protein-associated factor RNA polymerase I subunit A [Nerophis lumbriciformis]
MDDIENELRSQIQFDEHNDPLGNTLPKKEKKSRLPLAEPFLVENAKETGFRQTTRLCLERIREAMLHHRWQEAAEYLPCYPQILEDTTAGKGIHYKEIIWRIGIEILHHHPNSKMDDYNVVYERLKHSGVQHYLMICLEHAFHLLLHGQIENAKHHLSVAESWRYGRVSACQHQKTKLIQAYRSLLDYIIWCDKKSSATNTSFTNADSSKDMHSYFRQASVNLKEILKHPGVWDPFILSYVEMLEFYDDQEEAVKVLKNYAHDESFPPNPNAQVYLYQFLQRHNAPERKLLNVLKILHALVPSHELMLDYISFLLLSEKAKNIEKALGVVLDMLDYACWRTSMDVWKHLKDVIDKLQLHKDWKKIVAEKMAPRKEWWPALHFTRFHATEDARQRPQLMAVKASLTNILCPEIKLTYPAGQIISGETT